MGEVNVQIRGKSYGIACDDGQEERVTHMGQYVNHRIGQIAQAGAASNDSHLLVLTSLMMADEIHELRQALQQGSAAGRQAAAINGRVLSQEEERHIVETLDHFTHKINTITQALENVDKKSA